MSRDTGTRLVNIIKRIEYWEYVLGFQLGEEAFCSDDIDKYIALTYPKELKMPEVMARILGYKEE